MKISRMGLTSIRSVHCSTSQAWYTASAPSITSLPWRNLGLFPVSNSSFMTDFNYFFFWRSSQIRSSETRTPSRRSLFFLITLKRSGRYKNLAKICLKVPSSLKGPILWAFSILMQLKIILYKDNTEFCNTIFACWLWDRHCRILWWKYLALISHLDTHLSQVTSMQHVLIDLGI